MTHTNGPVPLGSADYAPRTFEDETLALLLKREWVLLLGPRQHGKTSALLRIRRKLIDTGLRCSFVDLQALPPALSFRELLEWFGRKVAQSLGHDLEARS
jgi:predicted AAA+ superfamily ATPase